MIRRLNSAQPGFRTLMTKTVSALEKTPAPDLEVIDKRWSQPQYWRAVAGALSPWTDRNLLAAVDMERDASGNLASKDTGTSANRAIMLRTFWI
ncbi:ABC transporter permease, partial [Ochrobactrum sp. SFR4]|nr:ABC transporter permease [Ochrobactrum sp. SFR4]